MGELRALVDRLDRHAAGIATQPGTLAFFQRTWSRLSAEQRLTQSFATLPDNAGPLHSQRVVHEALAAMQALSPGYFERFGAHVEALLWIEAANAEPGGRPGPAPRVRSGGSRRPAGR